MSEQDDKIFNLFIEESKEHLATIEEDLVALEHQGSNLDEELINKVFRAIHTIKGSSGFFSLHNIKNLTHAMESLLGLIRSRELTITPGCISLLLEGSDLLKTMLDDIGSIGKYNPAPLIDRLIILISPEKDGPQYHSVAEKQKADRGNFLFNDSQIKALQQSEKGGQYVYNITWELDQKNASTEGSIQNCLQELSQFGAIATEIVTSSDESNFFERSATLSILYSTVVEPALVYDIANDCKDQIRVICDRLITSGTSQNSISTVTASPDNNTQSEPPESSAPVNTEVQESHTKAKSENGSIRVNLDQLDKLMSIAGELVLARNALLRKATEHNNHHLNSITQQIDNITSELQEAIMATRMQSVGIIFSKFKRIVRDLAKSLNKKFELAIEGEDVELDKTIIEVLNDPLVHLVRNSADHGIETPSARIASGKSEAGHLELTARHEAGHVIIEIIDDGAGIDPVKIREKAIEKKLLTKEEAETLTNRELIRLIFKPGFSTVETVTEVSGRGVGMDVVLSNITKIGGAVDIESKVGKGTKIILKLPLTLAIIPSILVSAGKDRFAIPQLNVVELVRISAADVKKRIEKIGDSAVIRIRDILVPLVRLSDILMKNRIFSDITTGKDLADRRFNIADRRSQDIEGDEQLLTTAKIDKRSQDDRRTSRASAVNIIIVTSGVLKFGLIVDQFLDSEEIVVKPIGTHLKGCAEYAGATILGDGSVAFILNIAGISTSAELSHKQQEIESVETHQHKNIELSRDAQTYLVVKNNSEEQFAIPLGVVSRIERIKEQEISSIAGQQALSYGDSALALIAIEQIVDVKPRSKSQDLFVIVFRAYDQDVGIMVSQIVDIIDLSSKIDISTYVKPGILGSVMINKKVSLILDLHAFVDKALPEYKTVSLKLNNQRKKVLIVEDSPFFLRQLQSLLTNNGCEVITATNGEEGFNALLNEPDDVGLCITDIEMPYIDGVEMTRKIRAQNRFKELPIIAITSLSGDSAEKRAREAGISEYLIKLDREQILDKCNQYL